MSRSSFQLEAQRAVFEGVMFCPSAGCGRSARPVRRAGCGNGVMFRLLRHRQTKGAATDRLYLRPPRHISTLPIPDDQVIHSPPRLHELAERDGVTLSELIEKRLEKAWMKL